jgi:hypothetical protein
MPFIHRLGERIGDPCTNADQRCLLDAELGCDLIGRAEADAADVASQPMGVLRDQPNGIGAVSGLPKVTFRLVTRDAKFAPDSPLEGDGFEPSVPRSSRQYTRCRYYRSWCISRAIAPERSVAVVVLTRLAVTSL